MLGTRLKKCRLFAGPSGAPRTGGSGRRKRASTFFIGAVCLAILTTSGACGGGSGNHQESYERGISEQESCCNELGDPQERQACMDDIVRVDDPDVVDSEENQATYRCIEENFVCNPSTGHATQESAQAQLDCIDDL